MEEAIGGVDDLGGARAARADDPARMPRPRAQPFDPAVPEHDLDAAPRGADAAEARDDGLILRCFAFAGDGHAFTVGRVDGAGIRGSAHAGCG